MSSHTMTEKPFLRNCCTPGRSEQMPKTPGRDGIIHIVMSPLELMQRLATLVPFVRDRPQPAGHERRLGGPPFVPRSKLYEPHGQGRFTIGPRIPFRHVRQRRVRASTPLSALDGPVRNPPVAGANSRALRTCTSSLEQQASRPASLR
jgi:hypothetical protein